MARGVGAETNRPAEACGGMKRDPKFAWIRLLALEVIEEQPSTIRQIALRTGAHWLHVISCCLMLHATGLIEDSSGRFDTSKRPDDPSTAPIEDIIWRATSAEVRACHATVASQNAAEWKVHRNSEAYRAKRAEAAALNAAAGLRLGGEIGAALLLMAARQLAESRPAGGEQG